MTTIIVLKGKHQSGKTPTLKILEQSIRQKYKGRIQVLPPEKGNIGGSKDIAILLKIDDSKIIGIYSLGDYDNVIKENINLALSMQCDIIFCACQTRGPTVKAINSFISSDVKIIYKKRIYEFDKSKQDRVNQNQVYDLMKDAQL